MSFRDQLRKEMADLTVKNIKMIVSKYNKMLDIKPVSNKKKAEIIEMVASKPKLNKELMAKILVDVRKMKKPNK